MFQDYNPFEKKMSEFRNKIRSKQISQIFHNQREKRIVRENKQNDHYAIMVVDTIIKNGANPQTIKQLWKTIIDNMEVQVNEMVLNIIIQYIFRKKDVEIRKYQQSIQIGLQIIVNETNKNDSLSQQTVRNILTLSQQLLKQNNTEYNNNLILMLGNLCTNQLYTEIFITNDGLYLVEQFGDDIEHKQCISSLIRHIVEFLPSLHSLQYKKHELLSRLLFLSQEKLSKILQIYYCQIKKNKNGKIFYSQQYLNDLIRSITNIICMINQHPHQSYIYFQQVKQQQFMEYTQLICNNTIKLLQYAEVTGIPFYIKLYKSLLYFVSQMLSVVPLNLPQNSILSGYGRLKDNRLINALLYFIKDINIKYNQHQQDEFYANNKVWNILNMLANVRVMGKEQYCFFIYEKLLMILKQNCCESQSVKITKFMLRNYKHNQQFNEVIFDKVVEYIQDRSIVINYLQFVEVMQMKMDKGDANGIRDKMYIIRDKIQEQYKIDQQILQMLQGSPQMQMQIQDS